MGSDEDEVLAVFDALDDTLARRDLDGALELFTDDGDVTFWGSAEAERAVGPQALRELMALVVAAPGSFTLTYTERRVRVEGEAAWVNAAGSARWERPGLDAVEMPYRLTGVLVRRDGRWRWHTHHGSEPELPGP